MDNTRVAECYRATQANTMPMSLSTVDVNLFTKKQTVGYEVASCLFLSFRPKNEVKEQKEKWVQTLAVLWLSALIWKDTFFYFLVHLCLFRVVFPPQSFSIFFFLSLSLSLFLLCSHVSGISLSQPVLLRTVYNNVSNDHWHHHVGTDPVIFL